MSERLATDLVTALSSARKAFSLYPASHPVHRGALDALVGRVREATLSGPLALNLHLGRLYHESNVLPEDAPGLRSIADAFEAHRIESLTVHPGFSDVDATSLIEVVAMKPSADLDVAKALEERGITTVTVQRLEKPDTDRAEEREERRASDHAMYQRLSGALKQVTSQIGQSGSPALSETSAIVRSVLERFVEDSAAVLGLATLRNPSEADLFHSINTMIYSVTIGVGVGVSPDDLTSLGLCALLHDIGKAAFDREDPAQLERIRALHPRIGAEILSRMPDLDRTAMLVAYEHHMRPDGLGWPRMEPGYSAHPFSRIVAIADRYDRLTHDPPDGEGLTPDRAVIQLLRETGTVLDTTLTRVFVRAMGAFPVGCLVRLSDQSVGVISAPGTDPLQPTARLLYGADGLALESKVDMNLAGSELTIVEVVEPADLRETVSNHL